jgi:predicted ATPase/DNA-binding winged helix-turn-helix (wHTH) protein
VRASFGCFELDTTTYELRRDGEVVAVEPQVFDVLALLVRHRDRVVAKEELLDEVWGDRFVSESALTSRIKAARRAVDDDGRAQAVIRTAHGRGYRFVADLRVLDVDSGEGPDAGHNLPAERTPLFGREEAVAAVAALVRDHRVVSLLGLGGVGKTRLATAAARSLLDDFCDGVWFVDLVPADDLHAVETAVAHGAGLSLPAGDTRALLARLLDGRRLLLVVDNCEHVKVEVAELLDHLLDHTAEPHVLVTSREPLDLPDERRVRVEPLSSAGVGAPAVELMVASAERFGAQVSDDERPELERICRHLDGLPLAIELAAAQLRLLRPEEVAGRLDERFALLRARTAPGRERHASLISVLENTWDLLGRDEQDLVGALASFAGSFTVNDAEALIGGADQPVAPVLADIVDRSLMVGTGDGRFRLLESVRLFAEERTDRAANADRHAAWCLQRVGDDVPRQLQSFALATWCIHHYDDLRAAERHLLADGRVEQAALLVAASGLALHFDAGARAADALPRIDELMARLDEPRLVARVSFSGVLAAMAARAPELIARHGEAGMVAAEASGDPVVRAAALVFRTWSVVFDDPDRAIDMLQEARRLALLAGDDVVLNLLDSYHAFHLAILRRYEDAIEQATQVVGRTSSSPAGYDTFVAITALAALQVVHAPTEARRWVDYLLAAPEPEAVMWANQVVCSAILAANGETDVASDLAATTRIRLARAGQDAFPDLLVPAAVLAHHLGERDRAATWVRAVRDAGRLTQSFQVTCAYRRVREVTGMSEGDPLAGRSVDEVGEEAVAWMQSVVTA